MEELRVELSRVDVSGHGGIVTLIVGRFGAGEVDVGRVVVCDADTERAAAVVDVRGD